MNKNWIIVIAIATGMWILYSRSKTEPIPEATTASVPLAKSTFQRKIPQGTVTGPRTEVSVAAPPPSRRLQPLAKPAQGKPPQNTATYAMDEGLVVIHGDVVLGEPVDENAPATGLVALPKMNTWPHGVIPFHIKPSVKNPERVLEALEMFHGTAVQFVPYTDQEDVLVFEDSTGVCKSYVGRIGGKQPIWIPPGCEAPEVAHEIMHALGFVHEQNRSDRDQYIQVMNENIKEEFVSNFELLGTDMMKLSGLDAFDFESLMIYPTSMFAKSSAPTMIPKNAQAEIRPSAGLSEKDRARINRAFAP